MERKSVVILYGSETGTAEDAAYTVYERLQKEQSTISLTISSLDAFDIDQLPTTDIAIFIVSTTGDGDVPTNMKKFWSFILRKSLGRDCLGHVAMAVFGLGDSNYEKYNAAAR